MQRPIADHFPLALISPLISLGSLQSDYQDPLYPFSLSFRHLFSLILILSLQLYVLKARLTNSDFITKGRKIIYWASRKFCL